MPVAFNARYAQITGLRHREVVRRVSDRVRILDLIHTTDGKDNTAAMDCLEKGRSVSLAEVELRNCTGETFTAWLSFVPLESASQDDGGNAGIQIIRDVTAEARVQAGFKELLALSKERADDLERLVNQRTRELRAALDEVTRLSRTDELTRTTKSASILGSR